MNSQPLLPPCKVEDRHGRPTLVFEQFKTGSCWLPRMEFDHTERTKFLADRISECVHALIQAAHGNAVNYYEFEEEVVSSHFKNGKARKIPIVKHNEVESGGSGREAKYRLLKEVIRRINELADVHEHPWRKKNLKARARLIEYMAFHSVPENDLHVNVRPHPRNNHGLCYSTAWTVAEDTGDSGCRNSILFPEIMEFFPGPLLVEYRDRLEEFEWVFRNGFCEELHCPFDYWQRTRFLHQIVDLQQNLDYTWTVSVDDGPPQDVLIHWTNYPPQPLFWVYFTDEGMKGTGVNTVVYDYTKWENAQLILPRSIRTNQSPPAQLTESNNSGSITPAHVPTPE